MSEDVGGVSSYSQNGDMRFPFFLRIAVFLEKPSLERNPQRELWPCKDWWARVRRYTVRTPSKRRGKTFQGYLQPSGDRFVGRRQYRQDA